MRREERLGSHQGLTQPWSPPPACPGRHRGLSVGRPPPQAPPTLTNMARSSMLPGSSRRPPKRSVFFRFCSQALAIPAETGVSGAGAGPAEELLWPQPQAPLVGAALPPVAAETIQRAVTDPRLRARVQGLGLNPHPFGGPHASVIHESPETAGAGGSSLGAVSRVSMQETASSASPFLWLSGALAPLWGGAKLESLGAHSTPFPGADAGVFVD